MMSSFTIFARVLVLMLLSVTLSQGAKLPSKRVGDKATCVACNATLTEIGKDSKLLGKEEEKSEEDDEERKKNSSSSSSSSSYDDDDGAI